jgi:cell division protein FtsA
MSNKVRLATGLDLGSSSTRMVICAVENEGVRFLGYGEAPSTAWNRGKLHDQQALTQSVRFAMHEAEQRAQVSPEAAVVGVGGPNVTGINSRGLYEFGRKRQIEADDLRYAVELGARIRLEENQVVLQVCPQDFTIDGRAGYRNPRSIMCARLEANVHIVTASAQEHQGVIAALHQAHLAVEESIFEPVAGAYAAVLPEDRARGVCVVDIGAQSTHIAIYDGDALLLASTIPVAGDHFTRDISYILKVNYDDAEHLKREYGWAMSGMTADNSIIEIPSPEGRAPREAPRSTINEILEARAEELLGYIYGEIRRAGMEQSLLEGVVLIGGGALLNGMCDVAERVLDCQVRNGLPMGIEDWPEELDTPVWTNVAGLAMYSGRLKVKAEWKRSVGGFAGLAR